VLALCAAPFLLEHAKVNEMFPKDAIARAKKILAAFKGGVGAYSDSRGNPLVREEVAKFIEARDGVKADPNVSARACRGAAVSLSCAPMRRLATSAPCRPPPPTSRPPNPRRPSS
jgi:aspartate/methionine/tyrosine aminotransferase